MTIPAITRVELLQRFPFNNFEDFRKSIITSSARIGVDRGVAYRWAGGGIHASGSLKIQVTLLALLPFLTAISYVVYLVVTKNWLLLLTVPVLLIAYFVFHPSSAAIFGVIRSLFIGLSFLGLFYALFSDRNGLLAFTLSLIIIWYSERKVYQQSVKHLIDAITQHEDLLCIMWQIKSMNIVFPNGNEYWGDWKVENGQTYYYKQADEIEYATSTQKTVTKNTKRSKKNFCTNCGKQNEQSSQFCIFCGNPIKNLS